jgi:zinc transporter ZupT
VVTSQQPILVVLAYASAAALGAGLGAVPQAVTGRLPLKAMGWANALAAGLMLGVAYSLLDRGLGEALWQGGVGGVAGMAVVHLAHLGTGTEDLELQRVEERDPAYGYQVVLVGTLHAAYEGVAMGAAMLISLPFGIAMAIVLAVHNVPEAMLLTAVVRGRGMALPGAALLAVATKLNQVLLAVVTFAVGQVVPGLLPWVVGFGAGALLQLLLEELLPESYREAGSTGIALVTLLAMATVVVVGGVG